MPYNIKNTIKHIGTAIRKYCTEFPMSQSICSPLTFLPFSARLRGPHYAKHMINHASYCIQTSGQRSDIHIACISSKDLSTYLCRARDKNPNGLHCTMPFKTMMEKIIAHSSDWHALVTRIGTENSSTLSASESTAS